MLIRKIEIILSGIEGFVMYYIQLRMNYAEKRIE